MARRKPKYPNPPYVVSEDARKRFEALMRKDEPITDRPPIKGAKKWELWRWDTLEDVPQT